MVIDKTTGRGCAWSIASKTVTKLLIAEGIIGRAILESRAQMEMDITCSV